MRDVLLVRYGEVFLKGANRPHFLKVLTDNVKRVVKPLGVHVWLSDSRVYVSDFNEWLLPVSVRSYATGEFTDSHFTLKILLGL